MTTRERIIIVIMSLAILYGIYALFLSSTPQTTLSDNVDQETQVTQLIADIFKELKKERITETVLHTIARAEVQWTNDPFYDEDFSVAEDSGKTPEMINAVFKEGDFFYTGYLKMGEKKVAIINGMYYRAGEELERKGYIVRNIYPNRVVLGIKGYKDGITIPLVEDVP